MHSRRVLGAVALGAIVVAAISFAIVDVTLAGVACPTPAGDCSASSAPPIAIAFAALGALALLVSVLPAVSWIVEVVQHSRHSSADDDVAAARSWTRRPVSALDED